MDKYHEITIDELVDRIVKSKFYDGWGHHQAYIGGEVDVLAIKRVRTKSNLLLFEIKSTDTGYAFSKAKAQLHREFNYYSHYGHRVRCFYVTPHSIERVGREWRYDARRFAEEWRKTNSNDC